MKKILVVFGTRPEAIKMAPIINELRNRIGVNVRTAVTGQHRQMLDQVLNIFSIKPHYDLNLMKANQNLNEVSSDMIRGLGQVIHDFAPNLVLVHGDTATALSASIAAYYSKTLIGHVEAGLRTNDIRSPWPEEGNRAMISRIADLHFAPTAEAMENLVNERINSGKIYVTGNSVIDALLSAVEINKARRNRNPVEDEPNSADSKRIILVTGHRRENFGSGFDDICKALKEISLTRADAQIVYPIHLNPNVRGPVMDKLSNLENIKIIEPLDYLEFVDLMSKSTIILTDSGGIQEEGPALRKPVLVMRNTTERPEAVKAGTVKLVGTNSSAIIDAVNKLLDDPIAYNSMASCENPYGDGTTSKQICDIITESML